MSDLGLTPSLIGAARIDRKFVDDRGNLTQNGYALLAGLLERTGGTVASTIDMTAIANIINDALTVIDTLTNDVSSLRSEVTALEDANESLQRQIEGVVRVPDLTGRVQQIEDRLL